MKILIVIESLKLGGAENMAVLLSNTLDRKLDLDISFAANSGTMLGRLSNDINYYVLPEYNILSSFSIIKKLYQILSEIRPDIVHTHSATMAVLVGIPIRILFRRSKIVLTHHSRKFTRVPNKLAIYMLNMFVDKYIAISLSKQKEMIYLGVNKNKTKYIPNFVDNINIDNSYKKNISNRIRNEIGVSSDSKIILGCGNIRSGKGFERFVDIVKLCAISSDKNISGVIIGDGELLYDIKQRAKLYEGITTIHFLGYKTNIIDYLLASDVFLFPSEHEVMPMVLIEASSCGIPIVCSDILGNNDIVYDSLNGFLISGDNYEYSKKIIQILNNSNLQKSMSNQGLKITKKRFDKNLVINQIIQLYIDTVSNPL